MADGVDGVERDVHLTRDGHLAPAPRRPAGPHVRPAPASGPAHPGAAAGSWTSPRGRVWRPPPSHGAAHQQSTLDELLDLLLAAGLPMGLAVETKHPSPYGHGLEEALLVPPCGAAGTRRPGCSEP
ncbi:hypothetical protein QJS66_17490 [Kocuria rhizophila]|nr:hypothetical protein QJS66_17490 [Kocuria rhizophila]